MSTFRTIVADPPWAYGDRVSSGKPIRGAANHYGLMSMTELADLPVWRIAEERAHLYLWTTNAFVEEAHVLARAWGFQPKTMITWIKDGIGMGRSFRGTTEHVVFATRGGLQGRSHRLPTHFYAPRARHSEKPDELYLMAEIMSPGPYLEMFARRPRAGWTLWGDEAPA